MRNDAEALYVACSSVCVPHTIWPTACLYSTSHLQLAEVTVLTLV